MVSADARADVAERVVANITKSDSSVVGKVDVVGGDAGAAANITKSNISVVGKDDVGGGDADVVAANITKSNISVVGKAEIALGGDAGRAEPLAANLTEFYSSAVVYIAGRKLNLRRRSLR